MKLLKQYTARGGFSLVELLVALSVSIIVGGIGISSSISQYKSFLLNAKESSLLSALWVARDKALSGASDGSAKVDIGPFQGGSVLISGLQQVTFESFTGDVDIPGSILISCDGKTASITVTKNGTIDES